MQRLFKEADIKAHPPSTLDSYIDKDLQGDPLIKYDADQVLSRWLFKRHERQIKQDNRRKPIANLFDFLTMLLSGLGAWFQGLRTVRGTLHSSRESPCFRNPTKMVDIERNAVGSEGSTQQHQVEDGSSIQQHKENMSTEQHQMVLVVSQLWLFKLGGE